MNKTESAYAQHLAYRAALGEVVSWVFERIKLRLADNTWYTPDFFIILADGSVEFHEVKGFWRDDARVKWKVAAETFRWAVFVAVRRVRGQWEYERYGERT